MKKLNAKQYAYLLDQVTEGKSKAELPVVIKGFTTLLLRRHQLNLKDRIIQEYNLLFQEKTGRYQAQVTTVKKLSDSAKQDIINRLKSTLGYQVEIEEKLDPDLIGGFTIQVNDTVIDASVKSQLQTLKSKMVNS